MYGRHQRELSSDYNVDEPGVTAACQPAPARVNDTRTHTQNTESRGARSLNASGYVCGTVRMVS